MTFSQKALILVCAAFFWTLIIDFCLAQGTYVVTDCFHFERISGIRVPYPDFFSDDSLFGQKIISQTKDHLQKNFSPNGMVFQMDQAEFKLIRGVPAWGSDFNPNPAEGIKSVNRELGDFFVVVLSSIQPSSTGGLFSSGGPAFVLQLRVQIENKAGEEVFLQKVKIRFSPEPGDFLYWEDIIGRKDFQNLYFQALEAGFTRKKEKFKGVHKVAFTDRTDLFQAFIDSASQIKLVQRAPRRYLDGDYLVREGAKDIDILHLSLNSKRPEAVEHWLGWDANDDMVQNGDLINEISKESYLVRGRQGECRLFPKTTKEHGYYFRLHSDFNGSWLRGSIGYRVEYDPRHRLTKVFINDQLALMLQAGIEQKQKRKKREHHFNCWAGPGVDGLEFSLCMEAFVSYHISYSLVLAQREKMRREAEED